MSHHTEQESHHTEQELAKWVVLYAAYDGLRHVPRVNVFNEYDRLTDANWSAINAMEEALIKYGSYKDERPRLLDNAALEYEDIMEGEKIWEDIQKTSAT